jgi:hypothetical protein
MKGRFSMAVRRVLDWKNVSTIDEKMSMVRAWRYFKPLSNNRFNVENKPESNDTLEFAPYSSQD